MGERLWSGSVNNIIWKTRRKLNENENEKWAIRMSWSRAKWWICVKFPSHFNVKWTLYSAARSKCSTLASIIYFKLLSHYALDPLTLEIYMVCKEHIQTDPRTHAHAHNYYIQIHITTSICQWNCCVHFWMESYLCERKWERYNHV